MGEDPRIRDLHDEAVRTGKPGYLDPSTGYFVFTAARLAESGRCCGSGCRHCPYPAEEQRRAGRPTVRSS
jgi:hypothetical protein